MRPVRAKLLVVLLTLASLPTWWAALRPEGLAHRIGRLEEEVQSVESENLRLAEGNRRLLERARALKQRGPYLEGLIRRDLGMVRDGELVVRPAPEATPER